MSGYQRKYSMENFRWESTLKLARRNAIKTCLKPPLRISTYRQSPGKILYMTEQSGSALSEREQTKGADKYKPRESAKLNESTKRAKPEPRKLSSASSELTCSVCNRQFRVKIGLISHQRMHQCTRTWKPYENYDGLSPIERQTKILYEPSHDKISKIMCAPNKDSDQPGRPPSLISVFAVCM